MNVKYPKEEKLKSRKTIDLMFSKGKSVAKYPLRLVYVPHHHNGEPNCESTIKFGVSASKKYFKKATDRNYIKRVLREAYRLNKAILIDNGGNAYSFMLFYQSKEQLNYGETFQKTILLFEKFVKTIQTDSEIAPKFS